jgi:Ca-activated chloride channel family protein
MSEIWSFLGEWLSFKWFYPSTLQSFRWAQPFFFYLIPAVWILIVFKWLFYYRFRQKLPVAFNRKEFASTWVSLLRFIPDVVFAVFLTLLLVSLARPQRSNELVERYTDGIDIMLTMDISESMKIEDFKPNRLHVAKKVAKDFVLGRFKDRIGLVIFSGDAFSLCPLTTDYDLLSSYIQDLSIDQITKPGTAIGSALAVSINRMRESKAKSKVLLLLSDGDNNAGSIDPITAAKLADAFGIKVYAILIGQSGKVPFGKDFFGNTQYIENTVDETTLREIARIGKGKFYRASNANALRNVFAEINTLEKSEIKENRFRDTLDFYTYYLYWAAVVFLLWLLLKSTGINNFLED